MTLPSLALAWVIGVFLGVRYDASIAPVLLLAASAVLLAGLLVSARKPLLPAVLLALALLGILRSDLSSSESSNRLTSYHGLLRVELKGWVADDPESSGAATRFRFRTLEINTGAAWEPISGDVLITARRLNELASVRGEPFIRYGDHLLLIGSPQSPQPFEDFDYPAYLARQGIRTLLNFPELSLIADGGGLAPYRWIYTLRSRLSESLASAVPEPGAALGQALLLGLRAGIPDELVEEFRASGASHVLAISGLHVGILMSLSLGAGALLLGRRRQVYLLIPLAVIWLYVLLAGLPPTAARAAVMGSAYLAAHALGRPRSALPALGAAAAVMVGLDPRILWSASFQLSFAAMVGIALLAPPLDERLRELVEARFRTRDSAGSNPASMTYIVAMTIAATVTTAPLVMFYFHRFSIGGLPTSLLILPALPPMIVSYGMTAVVGLLSGAAAAPFGWVAWLLSGYVNMVVRAVSGLPGVYVDVGRVAPLAVWAYYGLLAALYFSGRLRRFVSRLNVPSPALPRAPSITRRTVPWWMLASSLAAAALVWLAVLSLPDGRLHVTFADVGQGDAVLITTPSGRQVVIDGGPSPTVAARLLGKTMPFWDRDIELVVATHPHSDHVTGLTEVLKRYDVSRVLERRVDYDSAPYREWRRLVSREGAIVTEAEAGQIIAFDDGVALEVLNPPRALLRGTTSDVDNASVVLRLTYGDVSFVLTGDVFREAELLLAATAFNLDGDVLKVAHHGSRTSSSGDFLDRVAPAVAVISLGEGNRFGHPHSETIAALEARLPVERVVMTKDRGSIRFTTDGATLWMESDR